VEHLGNGSDEQSMAIDKFCIFRAVEDKRYLEDSRSEAYDDDAFQDAMRNMRISLPPLDWAPKTPSPTYPTNGKQIFEVAVQPQPLHIKVNPLASMDEIQMNNYGNGVNSNQKYENGRPFHFKGKPKMDLDKYYRICKQSLRSHL
jgi:hypothetical protein